MNMCIDYDIKDIKEFIDIYVDLSRKYLIFLALYEYPLDYKEYYVLRIFNGVKPYRFIFKSILKSECYILIETLRLNKLGEEYQEGVKIESFL